MFYAAYLMQDDLVNHYINREDYARWDQYDEHESKNLISFGDDVVVEASRQGQVLMPQEGHRPNRSSENPTNWNFQHQRSLHVGIFQGIQNRLNERRIEISTFNYARRLRRFTMNRSSEIRTKLKIEMVQKDNSEVSISMHKIWHSGNPTEI